VKHTFVEHSWTMCRVNASCNQVQGQGHFQ